MIQVYIVIVNWNGLPDTLQCIESLTNVVYQEFSIIIVDNGSSGNDVSHIRRVYPQVIVLEAGRNLGFAGGNNLGIRHALENHADYILCLNNDTVVAPDSLGILVEAINSHADIGIATSAIFYYDEPTKLVMLGGRMVYDKPHLAEQIGVATSRCISNMVVQDVEWAEGSVLMMRAAVARSIGGFNEGFFAYFEDVDVCLKARALGWRCIAVPQARVWHKIGASSGGLGSPTAWYYNRRNAWHIIRHHASKFERRLYIQSLIKDFLMDWLVFFKRCIVQGEVRQDKRLRDILKSRITGAFSGWLGCTGPAGNHKLLNKTLASFLTVVIYGLTVFGHLLHIPYRILRLAFPTRT